MNFIRKIKQIFRELFRKSTPAEIAQDARETKIKNMVKNQRNAEKDPVLFIETLIAEVKEGLNAKGKNLALANGIIKTSNEAIEKNTEEINKLREAAKKFKDKALTEKDAALITKIMKRIDVLKKENETYTMHNNAHKQRAELFEIKVNEEESKLIDLQGKLNDVKAQLAFVESMNVYDDGVSNTTGVDIDNIIKSINIEYNASANVLETEHEKVKEEKEFNDIINEANKPSMADFLNSL